MVRRVVLASASPRRAELLRHLISEFSVEPADIDEGALCGDPAECVESIAVKKAEHAAGLHSDGAVIIAADTCVFVEGEFLGKPKNDADAARMLKRLSGRTHTVYTGVAVIDTATGARRCFCVGTQVGFAEMTDAEIAEYVATGEPADKAGAYGAQGYAARFVRRIDGDYWCVVGLPVQRLYCALRELEEETGSSICTTT